MAGAGAHRASIHELGAARDHALGRGRDRREPAAARRAGARRCGRRARRAAAPVVVLLAGDGRRPTREIKALPVRQHVPPPQRDAGARAGGPRSCATCSPASCDDPGAAAGRMAARTGRRRPGRRGAPRRRLHRRHDGPLRAARNTAACLTPPRICVRRAVPRRPLPHAHLSRRVRHEHFRRLPAAVIAADHRHGWAATARCRRASTPAGSWSSRRAIPPMATSPPTPPWCWPRTRRPNPRALRRDDRRRAAGGARRDVGRGRRARASSTSACTRPGLPATSWRAILAQGRRLRPRLARRIRHSVNVEYVSANPTGPMHVGHGRGAVFGDALANLLAFAGLDGDARVLHQRRRRAGRRARPLRLSCATARRWARTIGAIPEGLYPGDYLKPVGDGAGGRAWRARCWTSRRRSGCRSCAQTAIDMMMDMIREDLAALDIRHDVFFSERSLSTGPSTRSRATIDEPARARTSSTRAGWRRPRASRPRTGRTASRRCSAPPPSATTSTGRC